MMNLNSKFDELLQLVSGYIEGKKSCEELQIFSWEVIDYFTETPKDRLPNEEIFERTFWHAIWQIQHLCDDDHESQGITKNELKKALEYMKGEDKIPNECIGRRP